MPDPAPSLADLVNRERYPLENDAAMAAIIGDSRAQLAQAKLRLPAGVPQSRRRRRHGARSARGHTAGLSPRPGL